MSPEQKRHLINIGLQDTTVSHNQKVCRLICELMTADKNLDSCLEILSDTRNSTGTLIDQTKNWAIKRTSHWERSVFVTLTFRFDEVYPNTVTKEFAQFKELINRHIFKNAYRRYGKQLETISVISWDAITKTHIHCVIRIPERCETAEFKDLIKSYWRSGYADICDCDDNNDQIIGYILNNDNTVHQTRQCLDHS